MLNQDKHKINKRIITLMLFLFFASLVVFLFGGCTATKTDHHTSSGRVVAETQTDAAAKKETTLFDKSKITEENYSIRLVPIDPTKLIGQTTNPETGEKQWRNAFPVYEKTTKKTNVNKTKETTEAQTATTNQKSEATTDETAKSKIKFSVPWYAFLIVGFFGFATIIGLFFIWKLTQSISGFSGTLAVFENRLKTLER